MFVYTHTHTHDVICIYHVSSSHYVLDFKPSSFHIWYNFIHFENPMTKSYHFPHCIGEKTGPEKLKKKKKSTEGHIVGEWLSRGMYMLAVWLHSPHS